MIDLAGSQQRSRPLTRLLVANIAPLTCGYLLAHTTHPLTCHNSLNHALHSVSFVQVCMVADFGLTKYQGLDIENNGIDGGGAPGRALKQKKLKYIRYATQCVTMATITSTVTLSSTALRSLSLSSNSLPPSSTLCHTHFHSLSLTFTHFHSLPLTFTHFTTR